MVRVTFLPNNENIEIANGDSLWETILKAGIRPNSICGGKGICGRCKVLLKEGITEPTVQETELLSPEEIKKGIRLACQTRLYNNCTVEILPENRTGLQDIFPLNRVDNAKDFKSSFWLDANVEKIFLTVDKPSLLDQRSDWGRIKEALVRKKEKNLNYLQIPLPLLKKLPVLLREADFIVTVVICNGKITALEKGDTADKVFGMAFDLGTTTVAGYLIDLKTGKEVSALSKTNSQISYGDNIISRIDFTQNKENGLAILQKEIINTINELINETIQNTGISRDNIYEITIAANTCIHHLFLGIIPIYLASSPFLAAFNRGLSLKAKEIPALYLSPETNIYMLPTISAFIGSDVLAGILFNGMNDREEITLLIDLGTNGEVILSKNGELWACSTAAGPAFEGIGISCGMRAVEGAIDRVKLSKNTINRHVIGNGNPKGICGSGIIDLVSDMLRIGLIDKSGRLMTKKECPSGISEQIKNRLDIKSGENIFLLVKENETEEGKEIYLSQKDIREIQVAKAAIASGIKILLREAALETKDIGELFLAGSFGNFINIENAIKIDLLPNISLKRISLVGNAAGKGAELALCSRRIREIGEGIYKDVKYVELSTHPNFSKEFMETISF